MVLVRVSFVAETPPTEEEEEEAVAEFPEMVELVIVTVEP